MLSTYSVWRWTDGGTVSKQRGQTPVAVITFVGCWDMNRCDSRRLLEGGYLNDATINARVAQLNVIAGTAARAVYMASTYLFTMMRDGGYARVAISTG
jgi:hypothetical protein